MSFPNELASYIRAAAEQRRWLTPRRHDRRFLANNGILLHAVDTDVVKLFSSPWEVATKSGRRKQGYAEIFPEEDRQIVIALGEALANFIFHELNGGMPLLMLPPMGEELNDVFVAVARNAKKEGDKTIENLDAIRQLIRETAKMDNPSVAAKKLEDHAEEIARFLLGREGFMAELRRFGLLLRGARVASPEYFIENSIINDPMLLAALEPPTNLGDRIRFRSLRDFWFERLLETKSSSIDTALIDSDALVLARLEWINTKLAPKEVGAGASPTHRVVLITGDRAMHTATANVPSWRGSPFGFGELFLRHPKSYLAEPGVLEPPSDTSQEEHNISRDTQFDQWLDTWLSELNPGTDNFWQYLDELLQKSDQELAEWVAPLVTARPQIIDKFRDTWSAYTHNLVLDIQRSPLAQQLAKAKERGVIKEYQELVDGLEEAIASRIRETWHSCFSVAAEGGAGLIFARSQPKDMRSHNPPQLTFDRFPKTRNFVKQVLGTYKTGGMNSEKWNEALTALETDDESGYVLFLAMGVLFAAEGIWKVSAILAQRALTIAEHEKPRHVSGREAAYLCAVTIRHSARRVDDLAPIADLLDRAEKAYEQDRYEYPKLKAGPCRFRAERLALFIAYHSYRILLKSSIPDAIPDLEEIQTRIGHELCTLDSSSRQNGNSDIFLYTERTLLVNWCLATLLRFKDTGDAPVIADLKRYVLALESNIDKAGDDFQPSYYVEIIRRVSAILLARSRARSIAKKEFMEWFKNHGQHCVMKYDAALFGFFMDLAEGYREPTLSHEACITNYP